MTESNRREFMTQIGLAGAGLALLGSAAVQAGDEPKSKKAAKPIPTPLPKIDKPLRMGVIGTGGRGTAVGSGFAALPGAIVKVICDVDLARAKAAATSMANWQGSAVETIDDLRKIIVDPAIDAMVIATPDHWHAPAAIAAIMAGKHVYVEKPCCHNPHEGEMLVEAARKQNCIVQHGTQRRSYSKIIEAVQRVKAGDIGKVLLSRGWYNNSREETGKRTPAPVPAGLNWDLWQGPAPRREFTENVVHYKWHWFWHWGTGELGNNGVHSIDVCRWGLGVDYPKRVTAGGGRYHFQDDQETPDTMSVTYDFGDKAIIWEGRSCNRHGFEGADFGVAFYGDKATLVIEGANAYRLIDNKGKELERQFAPTADAPHFQNFLDAVQSGKELNAPIAEGFKSTLLCHLGNIAYRSGGVVNCDPATGKVADQPQAAKLWMREYQSGWEPKV